MAGVGIGEEIAGVGARDREVEGWVSFANVFDEEGVGVEAEACGVLVVGIVDWISLKLLLLLDCGLYVDMLCEFRGGV